MTPGSFIIKIMIRKNRQCGFSMIITLLSLAIAYVLNKQISESIWWFIGAIIISFILSFIYMVRLDKRIINEMNDNIRAENYELSVLLTKHGVLSPSKIKPLLEAMNSLNEE